MWGQSRRLPVIDVGIKHTINWSFLRVLVALAVFVEHSCRGPHWEWWPRMVRSSLFGLEVLVVVVVLVVSEVEGAGNGSAGGVVVNASCRGASDHASRSRDGPVPDAGGG